MAEPSKKDGAPGEIKCKGVVAKRMLSAPLENLRLGNVNNLSGISLESTVWSCQWPESSSSSKSLSCFSKRFKNIVAARSLSSFQEPRANWLEKVVIIFKFDGTWNGLHGIFPTYPTTTSNLLIQHLGIEVIQAIKSLPNSLMKTCSKNSRVSWSTCNFWAVSSLAKIHSTQGHYNNLEA